VSTDEVLDHYGNLYITKNGLKPTKGGAPSDKGYNTLPETFIRCDIC